MEDWFKSLDRKNTDSIKWRLAKEKCQGKECYTFSIADSDYETAPVIKKALLDRVNHGAFGYLDKGDDYEEIIIAWYKNRYLADISKDSIIPVPTVLNALGVCLSLLTKKGDGIIIQPPVYHVFKSVIEDNDRLVIYNPLTIEDDLYKIDFDSLEKLFKKGNKAFILCNPHNPVGRVWTEEELDRLIALAKKYNITIISDEIHSDIIMPGHKFISLAKYFKSYNNIIVISAPTKVFNIAGLQIAQIIVENPLYNKQIKDAYQSLHLTRPNLLALTALKAAYRDGQEWLIAQNKHIQDNYEYMKAYLNQFKNIFKVFPLQGTYLAWIKVSIKGLDTVHFVEELMKYGVFISEGEKFGYGDDFIRASLACSREQLKIGLKEMTKYLEDFDMI